MQNGGEIKIVRIFALASILFVAFMFYKGVERVRFPFDIINNVEGSVYRKMDADDILLSAIKTAKSMRVARSIKTLSIENLDYPRETRSHFVLKDRLLKSELVKLAHSLNIHEQGYKKHFVLFSIYNGSELKVFSTVALLEEEEPIVKMFK